MLPSCSRKIPVSIRRVAILPANILIADPASEWMRMAIPLVLEQDLATAQDLVVAAVSGESAAYQIGAANVLRTSATTRSSRFFLDASLIDVPTELSQKSFSESSPSLIYTLDAVAKRIDRRATPFSTHDQRALQAFATGLSSSDPAAKVQKLKDAVAADPSFGLGYIVLVQTLGASNGPDAVAAFHDGEAHRALFSAPDKVRFDLLGSRLLREPLSAQASAAASVVKVIPNSTEGLASLASNLFLLGRGAEAEPFMRRALQLNPDEANLRQQFASGLIAVKEFAKAEKILRGLTSNPAFVPQLAFCILLEGDEARANKVFDGFVSSVGNPDVKILLRATWQALAGNRQEAIRQLRSAQFTDPRVTALAQGQVVVWQLLDKQNKAAREVGAAANPVAAMLAAGASSADEWRQRVDNVPATIATPEMRSALLRNGYFLLGFYPEAAQAWEAVDKQAGGADLPSRTMLAASLKGAGKADQAKKVLVQPFLPDLADFYNAVPFSQLRLLLGQAG